MADARRPHARSRPGACLAALICGLWLLLGAAGADAAGMALAGARVWPAKDYTRLTIEAKGPLHWTLFSIENPERLVLDLEGIEPGPATDGLPARVRSDDPWIRAIRVGRFRPGVLRIVLDLKAPVKASASLLEPAGDYGYRLVLDVYPMVADDPVGDFLAQRSGSGTDAAAPAGSPSSGSSAAAVPGSANPASPAGAAPAQAPASAVSDNPYPVPVTGPVEPVPPRSAAASQAPAAAPPTGKSATPNAGAKTPTASETPPGSAEAPAAAAAGASPPAVAADGHDVSGERKDGRHKLPADRLITIAVDAGHGGEDPGAHGDGGTLEKDVTLAVAKLLKEHLDEEPNLRAVLVRDGDYFIPLQERTAKARHLHADLFVSVHADAYINRDARGSSVFALSERGATSVAARWLANRENQADLIGGVNLNARDPYLAQTLFDLSQTATINESLRLAKVVLRELSGMNPLHRGEVEQAGFAVLKSPDIPSILVETAFITNPAEERRLGDPQYQDKLATTIAHGIRRYLAAHPPPGKGRTGSGGPAS